MSKFTAYSFIILSFFFIQLDLFAQQRNLDSDNDGVSDDRDRCDNLKQLIGAQYKLNIQGENYIGIITSAYPKKYETEIRELIRQRFSQRFKTLKSKESNGTINAVEQGELNQLLLKEAQIKEYEARKEYLIVIKLSSKNYQQEILVQNIDKIVDEKGCLLDKDQDEVPDFVDICPDLKGDRKKGGCPDRDNDGIYDPFDNCPDKAGSKADLGCPDTDKDGLLDDVDECPNDFGSRTLNGCPDSDGDGVVDKDDKCPDEKGTKRNYGCPDDRKITFTEKKESSFSSSSDALSEIINTTEKPASNKEEIIQQEKTKVRKLIKRFQQFIGSIQNKAESELTDKEVELLKEFVNSFEIQIAKIDQLDNELKKELKSESLELQTAKADIEKRLARTTEQKERFQRIVLLITGISALLIIIVLAWVIRHQRKINLLLENKTQDLLIAQNNLHQNNQQLVESNNKLLFTRNELDNKYQELEKSKIEIERKKSMIEVLLNELHHRVRNNLVSISSMLILELYNEDEKVLREGLKKINERLGELEVIHRKLTFVQDDQTLLFLEDYIKEITDAICNLKNPINKPNILIQTNDLELIGSQAFYIGLVVYELVNNSFKYAFEHKEVTKPEISIELINTKSNLYELTIKDNGKGIPEELFENNQFLFEKVNSQGLKIIRLIAEINEGVFQVLPTQSMSGNMRGVHFHCALHL